MSEKTENEETLDEAEAQKETEETVKEKPKPEKEKREKKKEKGVFSYYKVEGESLTRQRPFCERCGPGYFMANHGDRFTCGHCGFTRYKQDKD